MLASASAFVSVRRRLAREKRSTKRRRGGSSFIGHGVEREIKRKNASNDETVEKGGGMGYRGCEEPPPPHYFERRPPFCHTSLPPSSGALRASSPSSVVFRRSGWRNSRIVRRDKLLNATGKKKAVSGSGVSSREMESARARARETRTGGSDFQGKIALHPARFILPPGDAARESRESDNVPVGASGDCDHLRMTLVEIKQTLKCAISKSH